MLSLVTIHYDQPGYLEGLLQNLQDQTYKPDEVIVVDDGSTASLVVPSWVTLIQRPRHPKNYPAWSGCVNAGVEAAHGDQIALMACNWALSPLFLAMARALLQEEPSTVWCAPNSLDFPRVVQEPEQADNNFNYVFWKNQWIPWDERYDSFGGIHALVTWIWSMMQGGMLFRYHHVLGGTHYANAPYVTPYARGDLNLSHCFEQAIRDGREDLQTVILKAAL